MKSQALSDKAKRLGRKHNVTPNFIINHYFFDAILKRIAKSTYCDTMILKGGFLLALNFGIRARTTNDLDFLILKTVIYEHNIHDMFAEILSIDIGDDVSFKVKDLSTIKGDQGIRINLIAKLNQIRQPVHIDIAINDPINPNIINRTYQTLVNNDSINIKTYPYETIIAEKLQTVVSLGIASSRCKDLYDLYMIYKLIFHKLELSNVQKAVNHTFKHRHTENTLSHIQKIITSIKDSPTQKQLWSRYKNNHYFAQDILFDDVLDAIHELIQSIYTS